MKFYDRENEVKKLREIERRSHEVAPFAVVTGRRRVGKSSLILKACENCTFAYLFVDKSGNVKVSGKIDGVKLTASTPLRIGGNEWFTVTADSIAYDKKSGMDYEFILGWDTIDPHTGVISVTPDPNADASTAGPDMHGFELWIEPFE